MNKEHFLTELKIHLKLLPYDDLQRILQQYETLFDEQIAQGEREELISKNLGNPREIANQILEEANISFSETHARQDGWFEFSNNDFEHQTKPSYPYSKKDTLFIRFCKVGGLFLLNIPFMMWVLLTGLVIIIIGWAVTLFCLASPFFGALSIMTSGDSLALFQLFFSIFLFGLGIIGGILSSFFTKYFFRFNKHYFRWMENILKRGSHT